MTSTTSPAVTPPLGTTIPDRLGGMARRLLNESAYLLLGFPLAVTAFVLVVTGLSVGVGLLITVIGLPILTGTAFVARGFARVERAQLRTMLGQDAPDVRYRVTAPDAGWFRRMLMPLADPQSWLDMLHALVGFITATTAWALAIAWWSAALGGLTFVLWGWAIPNGPDSKDLPELLGFSAGYTTKVVFYLVIGVIFGLTLPPVIHGLTTLRSLVSRALLTSRAADQSEVEQLVAGRDAARAAEAGALRRLERDIHDGPQQRLVRLSMDLGRARKQAGTIAPELQAPLDDALRQTQETLDELRALSRGIAPPVLADRGLTAALEELAARSSLPLDLDLDLPSARLPAHVETAAYFVASEALTNVAKHSGASRASLVVALDHDVLRLRVADDGRGGAHLSKGRGLAGLADRVRAASGALYVESPSGGPTVIEAELPCGS